MALLTPELAAKELGISTRQLRDLTDDGVIRWINIGLGKKRPTRRYLIDDLNAFIEERAAKCQSTKGKTPKRIPMTSSFEVVDFRAILKQQAGEKQNA